jgi:hypothetical protein
VAVLALGAQAALADTVERRANADPRGTVEIVNVAGDVTVEGWERNEVQVNAELGSGVERLEFASDAGRTLIKVVLPAGRTSSGASDLVVRIPRDSTLAINTVSADQTIEGVRGGQRLQAVSGSINTQVWSGDFEAKSVSGDVTARGHGTAAARVTTVSGDIFLHELGREIDLNTVTGDMQVRAAELERVRVKTTNGNLDFSSKLARSATVDAEAINGDLTFMLRDPIDAEFDIETFNGDIDNCFGPSPRRTREFAPGNELRFKQGEGSGRVRVKTLNGSVRICNR